MNLAIDVPETIPDEAPQIAQIIAHQLARPKILVEVHTYEDRPGYANMVRDKQIHDACCFDSSPLSTWRTLREKFHSGIAGPWWQGYHNPQVNQWLDQAAATPDEDARRALYRRAYRQIRDDAAWLFLYSPMRRWGVGPAAAGWQPRVDGVAVLV
jgi:peptide/nickel transport system substrate-binding protein